MSDPDAAYSRFAKVLSEYFTPPAYEDTAFILLLLPGVLILIWFFLTFRPKTARTSTNSRDIDFFEMVRLQKGLETFDRDILRELAETFDVTPIYKILLEKKVFEGVLRRFEQRSTGKTPAGSLKKRISYLQFLKRKLFQEF